MEKGIENLITSYINVFGSAEKTEKGVMRYAESFDI